MLVYCEKVFEEGEFSVRKYWKLPILINLGRQGVCLTRLSFNLDRGSNVFAHRVTFNASRLATENTQESCEYGESRIVFLVVSTTLLNGTWFICSCSYKNFSVWLKFHHYNMMMVQQPFQREFQNRIACPRLIDVIPEHSIVFLSDEANFPL